MESHPLKNSHCSYCGQAFDPRQPWPRTCPACGNTSFLNPLPVAVVLLPVDGGLLAIRRGVAPHRGHWALPGGYIVLGETWQEAGVRELLEETGVGIDPQELREFRVRSAPDGTLLIFGLARPRRLAELPAFTPGEESSERGIITQPETLAFNLHAEAAAAFFETQRDEHGNHPKLSLP